MVLICISLISDVEYLFMYLLDIHISSLEKHLLVICPFLNWVIWFFFLLLLNCMSSPYILDINLLLDICSLKIFSHSVLLFFNLLAVYFAMQKLSSLVWSHMFIFYFVCDLGIISKKSFPRPMSRNIFLCFLLGLLCFLVLNLDL